MPRGGGKSSAGRSSFRSSSSSGFRKSSSQPEFTARTAPPKASAPAPAPAPAPATKKEPVSDAASSLIDGFSFGAGNAMAHRFIEAIFGPRTVQHEVAAAPASASSSVANVCENQSKAFVDCLDSNTSNISKCQFYMDMLSECRRNPAESGLST